jgi:hypothetical protein
MKNDDRKHLTERKVERLFAAVKGSRHEARDRCLLPRSAGVLGLREVGKKADFLSSL